MRIVSLVDNMTDGLCPSEHGLSLYICLANGLKILFDTGQGTLFAENAQRLGIDLSDVDLAFISHGHYDHGGGLGRFLEINDKAKVYIREAAFEDHWSRKETGDKFIGLDKGLLTSPRLSFTDEITEIPISPLHTTDTPSVRESGSTAVTAITTFCTKVEEFPAPGGNALLSGPDPQERDDFRHEQSLLIREGDKLVLIAGCAHKGIVNILREAERISGVKPTHCLGGMHLAKSFAINAECQKNHPESHMTCSRTTAQSYIDSLARELMSFRECRFWTMHCTGEENFNALAKIMGDRIQYLPCGGEAVI